MYECMSVRNMSSVWVYVKDLLEAAAKQLDCAESSMALRKQQAPLCQWSLTAVLSRWRRRSCRAACGNWKPLLAVLEERSRQSRRSDWKRFEKIWKDPFEFLLRPSKRIPMRSWRPMLFDFERNRASDRSATCPAISQSPCVRHREGTKAIPRLSPCVLALSKAPNAHRWICLWSGSDASPSPTN